MQSLKQITENLIKEQRNPTFQTALLQASLVRMFGESVTVNIERIDLEGSCLVLTVANEWWRKELIRSKRQLLQNVNKFYEFVKKVDIKALEEFNERIEKPKKA